MKLIKFRGKDNHGKWYFGGITSDKKFITAQFTFQSVCPETIGQFTGFYDINHTELYEGDVIEINKVPYVIKWFDNRGCFLLENDSVRRAMRNTEICTIMGNVHDNPKLFRILQTEFLKQREKEERELEKC